MNIELLRGSLEVRENPGLETVDPRFSDIATLVQGGRYEDAAARAAEVLAEKIYDIRIIGYFLYGHFTEGGIPALADVYLSLASLLHDNIDAIGPVRNREKHVQAILNWLTKQLLKKLQYEEENKSNLYREWTEGVSSDQIQEVLESSAVLRRTLGPVLEDAAGPILDGMTKINSWLQAFQHLIYREPEPEEEKEPELEETGREEDEGEPIRESGQEPRKEERTRIVQSAPEEKEDVAGVEGSYHLKLLIKKLDAFETLITAQKYASAAIVADDINAIIATFDPRVYFPNLFVNFARQVAMNINNLLAYAEYKESAAWQALQDLYRIDLESFVSLDPEAVNMGASGASGGYRGPDEYDRMPEDEER